MIHIIDAPPPMPLAPTQPSAALAGLTQNIESSPTVIQSNKQGQEEVGRMFVFMING